MKLGSLFDGAGGFPFAAQICGIEPVWASEIEPFPIAVTRKRFPNMKHLGDVTKVNGAEIEPVDIITFGSPCQSVSVAGKREGAKHTGKGDEETTRSGLFYEAIRIIKEMREATNGRYPRIAVLENVPGFFSSAKGEDWRLVLEAFCRIIDEDADVPRPANGKWSYAGEIVAAGYSVAWRVLDPRKCVPQRRRRIFLVADFGSDTGAEQVLFDRSGLRRNFAESREAWNGITKSLAFGSGDTERTDKAESGRGDMHHSAEEGTDAGRDRVAGNPLENGAYGTRHGVTDYTAVVAGMRYRNGAKAGSIGYSEETAPTLSTDQNAAVMCFHLLQDPIVSSDIAPCLTQGSDRGEASLGIFALDRAAYNQGANAQFDPGIDGESGKAFTVIAKGLGAVCYTMATAQGNAEVCEDISPTVTAAAGMSGNNQPITCYAVDCRNARLQEVNGTLQAKPNGGISYNLNNCTLILTPVEIILRRLTPTECARLQGMPDWYCDDIAVPIPTEEDMAFWREVFETHRRIVTGASKPKTDKQIRKWLADPVSDAAQYKMWGNGMALPCVLYVMEGIKEALEKDE